MVGAASLLVLADSNQASGGNGIVAALREEAGWPAGSKEISPYIDCIARHVSHCFRWSAHISLKSRALTVPGEASGYADR
jgi:hypothetical protein